ncbi:BACON domain-containing protein [Massilibacteroides vaginae]|uniref:BACON domain-containing protein n=1 Tax=Massilibacteroides vaginae TaxID=1673718 RepID=UPI000A1C9921|nr:BACON domain-containing protein [Massilibacteroides vaginae]
MKQITFLILLLCCISCDDDKKEPEPPEISLDRTEITFEDSGGEITLKLIANNNWTADNIPDWIIFNHISEITFQMTFP